MYFSDPLTIVLSNPGVSRLSEAQIARISPVGIGHANEAEAGVPYYDDTFDEDDECTTADISDPDGSIALGLSGMYYECLCSMVLRPVERLVFSPKER